VKQFVLGCFIAVSTVSLAVMSGPSRAQQTAAVVNRYEFEVATIRPAPPNASNGGFAGFSTDDTFQSRNFILRPIIRIAYGKSQGEEELIKGGPSWLDSERYDITAKMEPSVADALQKLKPDDRELAHEQMLQKLLGDRLKLVTHREAEEMRVYFLTLAKNGSKLKQAMPDDPYTKAFPCADKFAGRVQAGKIYGVGGGGPSDAMTETLYAFGVTMTGLARQLTFHAGHTVVDRTGLTGSYDFVLKFGPRGMPNASEATPDSSAVPIAPDPSGAPDLFTANQQQLGLKLVSGKGPVEVIVIDYVEKPSGN